jgi:WD40 repeat protein
MEEYNEMIFTSHEPLSLVYCYADEDYEFLETLQKYLRSLQKRGWIKTWSHHDILGGTKQREEIERHLLSAHIILLLVSVDFLSSPYYEEEIEIVTRRYEAEECIVVPILLRAVDWKDSIPNAFRVFPQDGSFVKGNPDQDKIFEQISQGIRSIIENMLRPAFIAYSPCDEAFATQLHSDLATHSIVLWSRVATLGLDSSIQEESIRQAIRTALIVILIASPNALDSTLLQDQIEVARIYKKEIIGLWVADDKESVPTPARWKVKEFIDARGEFYTSALRTLLLRIHHHVITDSPLNEESIPESLTEPRNPYKGLFAFTSQDTGDFFGRERLIQNLVEEVRSIFASELQESTPSQFLTLVGPSGSGKSSVVMAGLLPLLQQGILPGSNTWIYLDPVLPGVHPLEHLAASLAQRFPEKGVIQLCKDLTDDSIRTFYLLATQLVGSSGKKVVLFIDQFEEVFTLTTSKKELQHFLDLLVTAATTPRSPLLILVTLRADFDDRPMHYPSLYQLIQTHRVPVLPMSVDDLRSVIERPAALPNVQLFFEDDLVGDILFDTREQVGALPLLQFTLEQLFHLRKEHLLTFSAYRKIGGIKGALAHHAESIYASLPSEQQRLARALFQRLIDPGTFGKEATRRRIALSALTLPDSKETENLDKVTKTFIEARLLTANKEAGVSTLEISHEALIQAWGTLAEWLRESTDDIRLQKAISEDAAEWRNHEKSVDRLYRGSQFAEALAWRSRSILSLDEEAFLKAGEKEQWRFYRRNLLIGMVGLGIVGTSAFLTLHTLNSRTPVLLPPYVYFGHHDVVDSVAWSPKGDLVASASVDLTVQVWNTNTGITMTIYTSHRYRIWSVVWSPDGTRIASADDAGVVQIWDPATGKTSATRPGNNSAVYSVAWSPDGTRIALATDDATVQVWDVDMGKNNMTYNGHSGSVDGVAWSPDSVYIASASSDGTVQVWESYTGLIRFTCANHQFVATCVAWSPNGRRIASGSNNIAQVWDANTGKSVIYYTGDNNNSVKSLAWSPDSMRIVSSGDGKTVRIWDANTGRNIHTYIGHIASVECVAWSPNGKLLASASDDKTVRIWDATFKLRKKIFTYTGHQGEVTSVAWSPNGTHIASAAEDVQVWDATTGKTIITHNDQQNAIASVAWSPNGKLIASASNDVQVWDTSSGKITVIHKGHQTVVTSVAWSPDSTRIASAGENVEVWDANTNDNVLIYTGHNSLGIEVTSVAWSPDGTYIASSNGEVHVWNASTGKNFVIYTGHQEEVTSVAWSPDGTRIASASWDSTVHIWYAYTAASITIYTNHSTLVSSVAWSPDGKLIASASWDGTVLVWQPDTGKTLFASTDHFGAVNSVAWSPDGKLIASAGRDRTVQVWSVFSG